MRRGVLFRHACAIWLTSSKFEDSVWRISSADGIHQVVISPCLLPELRKLPDSVISISKALEEVSLEGHLVVAASLTGYSFWK